jgi:hypothetical protein
MWLKAHFLSELLRGLTVCAARHAALVLTSRIIDPDPAKNGFGKFADLSLQFQRPEQAGLPPISWLQTSRLPSLRQLSLKS